MHLLFVIHTQLDKF